VRRALSAGASRAQAQRAAARARLPAGAVRGLLDLPEDVLVRARAPAPAPVGPTRRRLAGPVMSGGSCQAP